MQQIIKERQRNAKKSAERKLFMCKVKFGLNKTCQHTANKILHPIILIGDSKNQTRYLYRNDRSVIPNNN